MGPEDFDFLLPDELIAQYPLPERDASRLLVLSAGTGSIEHSNFKSLDSFLLPGDLLVLNDTRVMAARLLGTKESGGAVELLLLKRLDDESESESGGEFRSKWLSMAKSSKGLKPGAKVNFAGGLKATVIERDGEYYTLYLDYPKDFSGGGENIVKILDKVAFTPLPPYIKRKAGVEDKLRYQTIYARENGAVAAPTAGLHFTTEVFSALEAKGVEVACLTLHTGPGTFRPVRTANLAEHTMHKEEYFIDEEVFERVRRAKAEGRRVVAVGSTSTRTLEAAVAGERGFDNPKLAGETGIFIYPGFKFKVVDALITNFHLPRSTLIMLVSAFATREFILKAYAEAVKERYRFFSYGDCMLIS